MTNLQQAFIATAIIIIIYVIVGFWRFGCDDKVGDEFKRIEEEMKKHEVKRCEYCRHELCKNCKRCHNPECDNFSSPFGDCWKKL